MPIRKPQKFSITKKPFRILLYGASGTGKTLTASTAQNNQDLSDVLFLNTDEGLMTLGDRDDILFLDFENQDDLNALIQEFRKPRERRAEPYNTIRTIVIDSISRLKDNLLDESRGDAEFTTFNDYNRMMAGITDFIDELATTDVNFIGIAGEKIQNINDQQIVVPDLNPALWMRLRHRMDFIWRTFTEKGRYKLQVLPNGEYLAKTRGVKFADALAKHNLKTAERMIGDTAFATIPKRERERIVTAVIVETPEFSTISFLYDLFQTSMTKETNNND
jgi:hypothetical protein